MPLSEVRDRGGLASRPRRGAVFWDKGATRVCYHWNHSLLFRSLVFVRGAGCRLSCVCLLGISSNLSETLFALTYPLGACPPLDWTLEALGLRLPHKQARQSCVFAPTGASTRTFALHTIPTSTGPGPTSPLQHLRPESRFLACSPAQAPSRRYTLGTIIRTAGITSIPHPRRSTCFASGASITRSVQGAATSKGPTLGLSPRSIRNQSGPLNSPRRQRPVPAGRATNRPKTCQDPPRLPSPALSQRTLPVQIILRYPYTRRRPSQLTRPDPI